MLTSTHAEVKKWEKSSISGIREPAFSALLCLLTIWEMLWKPLGLSRLQPLLLEQDRRSIAPGSVPDLTSYRFSWQHFRPVLWSMSFWIPLAFFFPKKENCLLISANHFLRSRDSVLNTIHWEYMRLHWFKGKKASKDSSSKRWCTWPYFLASEPV